MPPKASTKTAKVSFKPVPKPRKPKPPTASTTTDPIQDEPEPEAGPSQPAYFLEDEISSEDEDEDEDDPIISRFPLYFNSNPDFTLPSTAHFQPTLDDDDEALTAAGSTKPKTPAGLGPLTLLQYPHRPLNLSTSHPLLPPSLRPGNSSSTVLQPAKILARYKPGVRDLALDVPLEVRTGTAEDRFSDDRGRELAKGTEAGQTRTTAQGKRPLRDDEEPDPLDRITLASTSVPEQTHYLVGVKRGDEVHLIPLGQTLQLRPSLDYLDRISQNEAQEDKVRRRKAGEEEDSDEDEDGEKDETGADGKKKATAKKKVEEAKAVQVTVAGVAGDGAMDRGNGRAGASLFAPLRAAEAELWVQLDHFHSETKEAEAIRSKMCCSDPDLSLSVTSPWQDLLKTTGLS